MGLFNVGTVFNRGGHTGPRKKFQLFLGPISKGSWVGPKSATAALKLNFKFRVALVEVGPFIEVIYVLRNSLFRQKKVNSNFFGFLMS